AGQCAAGGEYEGDEEEQGFHGRVCFVLNGFKCKWILRVCKQKGGKCRLNGRAGFQTALFLWLY
ncbi:TPA: hypothetical protein ACRR7B_002203, partial [Neisseria gonorrhoeae]